ncbi:Synaptonemal complex protein 1 [Forsythia ovata]|uniref:Synaptonemal complex protein 1 n=1 Tax=Forsythia ovata TaxID=205694 RepID=A0ABD1PVX6_9LAMI
MSRLQGFSGLKNLEQFKYLSGSAKTLSISSRVSSDSVSLGSFANLKLTAEKLVKEQASAKTDLELANSKLKKLTDHIRVLEEKLQNAFNENAKLKVKQKEDEKLWKGLESKFSSTKTLCDQLTETLQHLAVQVKDAEKDKAFFEDKFSTTSVALDNLHEQMKSLSIRLNSSENTVKSREKELMELGLAKENMENSFRDEQSRVGILIEEKDAMIKNLEEAVATNKMALESLTSKMDNLHLELRTKEDDLRDLRICKEKLERENFDLLSSNKDFASRLEKALAEIKNVEEFVNVLVAKFTELENQSLTFAEKVIQLNALFDSCFKLVQQEKDLSAQCAKQKFDQIQNQSVCVTSEKNALQLVNLELNSKVIELQKEQEFTMAQHAEECRLAEAKILKLDSEAETLLLKQTEMETLIIKLEENINTSSEKSRLSENKMKDLLLKLSELEMENKDLAEKLQADILKKQDEIDLLHKEMERSEENIASLQKRCSQLDKALDEKDQLISELKMKEKQFEDHKSEIQAALADAESKLMEAKKQHDQMLESKQLELSRHLKEISQKNDQAINDIRRKYEVEKLESVNLEKEKADEVIGEMERQCEQRIAESQKHLMRVQEEHASMISRIQQEHDAKEMGLISKHGEELKCLQLQAENEFREKTTMLRSEHDAQLRALTCEHEDECRRLQEDLDIQKSKEERQRALLQMQWKVMSNNPQEDQEVNSKKNYSISSKMRNSDSGKRNQHALERTEDEEKDSPYQIASQTPVSNLLKKVEKVKGGTLPQRSRKVTHHEYEVETSNGRTITKRRKTKSTVMFGDPRKHRKRETPKAKNPKDVTKGVNGGVLPNPSNIGDLFTEGSLNPYADDPYAFD